MSNMLAVLPHYIVSKGDPEWLRIFDPTEAGDCQSERGVMSGQAKLTALAIIDAPKA